jgi:hypothetical protein
MLELLYFILCSYGLTQILVYGSIFNKIRPAKEWFGGFGELFHCPMCMGWWSGVFLWGINRFTELFTFEYNFINLFILGCIASGTSYILCTIFGDEGIKYEVFKKDDY